MSHNKRSAWIWLAVVLAVFGAVALLGRSSNGLTAEVDNDGEVDGDEEMSATNDPIIIAANAIQQIEGWFPNSRSFRNKNPGNLRVTGATGQIGVDDSGMAIFDSYEDGFDALLNDLEAKAEKHPTFSIQDIINRYAPASDGNNPQSYAARVAAALNSVFGNVSTSTNWSSLVNQYSPDNSDDSDSEDA